MSRLLVVLDTNILVSALLRTLGPSARVLDLVLSGMLQVAYDDRVLAEWREVLARPRFGFRAADVDALLHYLQQSGLRVTTCNSRDSGSPRQAPSCCPIRTMPLSWKSQ